MFEREEVTLEILPRLSDADLAALGVGSLGARLRIHAAATALEKRMLQSLYSRVATATLAPAVTAVGA